MGVESSSAFAVDVAAIAAVSVGICLASDRLLLMSILVPLVVLGRFAARALLPAEGRATDLRGESLFFALCTVLGAINDYNTVVRHGVYDYRVPVYWPEVSTIPIWMLLFWGLILRSLVSLFRWEGLRPPDGPRDEVGVPGRRRRAPLMKLAIMLGVVLLTRQAVYRWWEHPVLSWLPFAAALGVVMTLFGVDRHELRLLAIFAIVGPGIEVLYIQQGHLHSYALGWLGGVPVWIALWWLLAVLIWKDLSLRLLRLPLFARP